MRRNELKEFEPVHWITYNVFELLNNDVLFNVIVGWNLIIVIVHNIDLKLWYQICDLNVKFIVQGLSFILSLKGFLLNVILLDIWLYY